MHHVTVFKPFTLVVTCSQMWRCVYLSLCQKVNTLQARLNDLEPVILDTLESLVDPKILSADRSKLHVLLQNTKR